MTEAERNKKCVEGLSHAQGVQVTRPFCSPLASGIALPLAIAMLKARVRAELDSERYALLTAAREEAIMHKIKAGDVWSRRHSSRESRQS